MDKVKNVRVKNQSRLTSFLKPLSDLQKLISLSKNKGIIIGGIASNLLGKPRFTADIDAVMLVEDSNIEKLLRLAKNIGFIPRVKNPIDFALKNRVVLLQHKQSLINIDISLGLLPFEIEAIERSIPIKIGKLDFSIPTPEDLIIFKAVAHREKDLMDIREIVNVNPKIDTKRIKKIVIEFAKALEVPEIWNDLEKIIKQKAKKK